MVAHALSLAHERDKTAEAAPAQPMAWLYGRLRYPTEKGVPKPTRLPQLARRLLSRLAAHVWYGRLHQPRTSPESETMLPDLRLACASRDKARSKCGDKYDFIIGIPYGDMPLGDDIMRSPTFCRPLWKPHRKKDAHDAELYVENLEERLCADLTALRAEVEALRRAARV